MRRDDFTTTAKAHYKALLEKALLGFLSEDNPEFAMLEWVAHRIMLIEAEGRVRLEKA